MVTVGEARTNRARARRGGEGETPKAEEGSWAESEKPDSEPEPEIPRPPRLRSPKLPSLPAAPTTAWPTSLASACNWKLRSSAHHGFEGQQRGNQELCDGLDLTRPEAARRALHLITSSASVHARSVEPYRIYTSHLIHSPSLTHCSLARLCLHRNLTLVAGCLHSSSACAPAAPARTVCCMVQGTGSTSGNKAKLSALVSLPQCPSFTGPALVCTRSLHLPAHSRGMQLCMLCALQL